VRCCGAFPVFFVLPANMAFVEFVELHFINLCVFCSFCPKRTDLLMKTTFHDHVSLYVSYLRYSRHLNLSIKFPRILTQTKMHIIGSKIPNSCRKPASIKEAAFGRLIKGRAARGPPPWWESFMRAGFRPEFGNLLPSI
jgi:hypothetical protein